MRNIQPMIEQRQINADFIVRALGWKAEYDFGRRQFRLYSDTGRLMARRYTAEGILAFVETYTADRAIRLPSKAA